jgi:uncharacterized membrane protein
MPRCSILFSGTVFVGVFLATLFGNSAAQAETYRAGQFTVTEHS